MSAVGVEGLAGATGQAVLVGVASAACFAISNSLQHREVGRLPETRSPLRLLVRLATRPKWLAGTLISFVAFGLHALALTMGSIATVQPLMILGVVLAVPVRAALDGQVPSRAEFAAVMLCCAGVGGLVVLSAAEGTYAEPDSFALLALGFICWVGAWRAVESLATWWGSKSEGVARALGAGLLFGFSACLLKVVTETLSDRGVAQAVTAWPLWLLVATGVAATGMNQRAYQQARISQTMPILNAIGVSIAIVAGWTVFGATPAFGTWQVIGYPLCLGAVLLGLRRVALVVEPQERHAATPVSVVE